MARKEKKSKAKREGPPQSFQKLVESVLASNTEKAFSVKQVVKRAGMRGRKSSNLVNSVLKSLVRKGKAQELRIGRYQSTSQPRMVTGTLDHVNPRFAYLVTDDPDQEDIWIKTRDLHTAWDSDRVKIVVYRKSYNDKKAQGKVIEVLDRARTELVGRIELNPKDGWVIPDNRKLFQDVFIPPGKSRGAKESDKVIVRIENWVGLQGNPEGKVIEVLGPAGNHEVEMHSIMAEFGLPVKFPNSVIAEVSQIKNGVQAQLDKRLDLRDNVTFTIDPADAKDFDDALSIKKLGDSRFEIGVHIADVSHYVRPGTKVESEARSRGTSVYLVDRTIPMLPERLSNELCSLRPQEEKLTFSAIFEMNSDAEVISYQFAKSIILSNRRFTYEEVQKRIETRKGDYWEEIHWLNDLAGKLRVKRFEEGSINFDTIEVKFKLDPDGTPVDVVPKIRREAHKLVEDFMLLANRKVADHVFGMKSGKNHQQTFVYRVHDNPDQEKLQAFALFARKFGYNLDLENSVSKSLNDLISRIERKPEQNVLESLAIRTMAKAIYTTEAKGHFGLAFSKYTHFTSPIRRYPDLMVHRLLHHYLQGGKSLERAKYDDNCRHSSEMELRATNAERASIKFKQVQYMENAEDRTYDGMVSGVTEWGIFVEIIETHCEGMVRLSEMLDDFYEFDERNYRVVGARKKRIISLGDQVQVRVLRTDVDRRTIDLTFATNDQ